MIADNIQQRNQLEDLSKLVGELAHELKNPLSTVKVNLKLVGEELNSLRLKAGDFTTEISRAQRKLEIIQQEADRLEHILDAFLKYIGRTELRLVELDINELVSDMIDFYMPQAQTHSITIHHHLSSSPLICAADSTMLKQVMLNLFINAQQAMTEGGELLIRTSKSDSTARIQISDTGPGIPPDRLERIFEPFFSSRPDGSGLGLAIAKRIVNAHNGNLTVTSEPGKGTSFTIELPLANVQDKKD